MMRVLENRAKFDPEESDNEDDLYPVITTKKQFDPEESDNEE